ncbi:MAG: hypothetical protein KDH20_17055 [Rhodocyclaceae bacterium]|nr:hypothetical protein [Rhodocyclaceae bacterium]
MKVRALTHLLDALSPQLATGHLRVSASWRNNEQALGLEHGADPALMAYVFTYGQPLGRYGLDLGYPDLADAAAAGVPLVQEHLDLPALIGILGSHFDLHPIPH